jgi:ubiquinol-cytochrome c reductase cytochrome c subunit
VAVAAACALWLLLHGATASASTAGVQPGADIYGRDCAFCHGARGEGSFRGPPIADKGVAAVDFMVSTGRMPIADPQTNIRRRSPKYSPDEIAALDDYVSTFVTGPAVPNVDTAGADVAAGGEAYRLNCASCHQMVGAGGALAYGTVAPALGSATPTQVAEAMRVGPGNMPVFGAERFPDDDVADIAAYVDYLKQPEDRGGLPLWHVGPVPEGLVAWLVGLGSLLLLTRWLGTREPAERS